MFLRPLRVQVPGLANWLCRVCHVMDWYRNNHVCLCPTPPGSVTRSLGSVWNFNMTGILLASSKIATICFDWWSCQVTISCATFQRKFCLVGSHFWQQFCGEGHPSGRLLALISCCKGFSTALRPPTPYFSFSLKLLSYNEADSFAMDPAPLYCNPSARQSNVGLQNLYVKGTSPRRMVSRRRKLVVIWSVYKDIFKAFTAGFTMIVRPSFQYPRIWTLRSGTYTMTYFLTYTIPFTDP